MERTACLRRSCRAVCALQQALTVVWSGPDRVPGVELRGPKLEASQADSEGAKPGVLAHAASWLSVAWDFRVGPQPKPSLSNTP